MMKNPFRGMTGRRLAILVGALLALLLILLLLLLPRPAEMPEGAAQTVEMQGTVQMAQPDAAAQSAPELQPVTDPQQIADYLFTHGKLPDNFLTRREAEALGWDSSVNCLSDVAPGMSLGGDRFGNYEGLVPKASGRTWKECDANYRSGPRGVERIVYSNDGMVFYSDDHYESFTQMFPSPD